MRFHYCLAGMAALLLAMASVIPAAAAGVGAAAVADGRTLTIAGQAFRLYGIAVPRPGDMCRRKQRRFDCAKVAASQLADLTAGAIVRCVPVGNTGAGPRLARCSVDGYDLSGGMVYTGWARADGGQTDIFNGIESEARRAGRGLWASDIERPPGWR